MIAGIANGPVCYSTNAGANWYPSSVINGLQTQSWVSVASSADGQHMAAIGSGVLYFSTNFGELWTPTNLPTLSWNSVCLSSDGSRVGATGDGGTYISTSSGASWITNSLNGNGIACSANGTNWIITGAEVYTSSDGGVTWVTNNLSPSCGCQWYGAAVSADGCELVASWSQVWMGCSTPSPVVNIQATNGNVALSWLVPSTNFLLQQNSNLLSTNWAAVTSSPALNFTNLQDEITLLQTPDNTFFRLVTQ